MDKLTNVRFWRQKQPFHGALGGLFVLVLYMLIQAAGYTATQAGAALLPLPLVTTAASPAAGALAAKVGPR
jgi:hypothetical protein